jgi:hypothetical protein
MKWSFALQRNVVDEAIREAGAVKPGIEQPAWWSALVIALSGKIACRTG